jgi:hypothetical protein
MTALERVRNTPIPFAVSLIAHAFHQADLLWNSIKFIYACQSGEAAQEHCGHVADFLKDLSLPFTCGSFLWLRRHSV